MCNVDVDRRTQRVWKDASGGCPRENVGCPIDRRPTAAQSEQERDEDHKRRGCKEDEDDDLEEGDR